MKQERNILGMICAGAVWGLLAPVCSAQQDQMAALDTGQVTVQSTVVRQTLGISTIKMRNRTTSYVPQGRMPVLQLREITDQMCRASLEGLLRRFPARQPQEVQERDMMAVRSADAAYWVSRASGAYKYTSTAASMAAPTKMASEEALTAALDYIARNKLVELTAGEEMDVMYVSRVKSHVSGVRAADFISDHYVAFGRRYHGVPVIGSSLVMRIDGNGRIAMVAKEWRPLAPAQRTEAVVTRRTPAQLIAADPEVRSIVPQIDPQRVRIVSLKCGYIEAPMHFRQEELRPGCQVAYQVAGVQEGAAHITVPLEDGVSREMLLGPRFDGRGR